ncbi:MAG: vitamin K epoxide reductase family protein [Anaerolineae bacterium]|nr:vitamin K epoxide reductase family protein [Anaerolineae bacterium]
MATKTVSENTQSTPRNTLFILSLIFVVIGLVISGYLSYTKLTNTSVACVESGAFNCDLVSSSAYSRFMGIEVAYLGFASYLLIGALILLEDRIGFLQSFGPALVFGITLFGFLFSMWLVYAQVVLLQALCPWCLAHELNITLLFVVSLLRLRQSLA